MHLTRATLGIFLFIGLLGEGAARGESTATPFDGEQLLQGLLLAEGPVARSYPELILQPSEPLDPARVQQLTDRIESMEPGFLATFEADMTSGDRVRIKRSADAAITLATAAAGATAGPENSTQGAFIVVDKTIVRATNTVVNKNRYWSRSGTPKTGLDRERWVNDVAESLAR